MGDEISIVGDGYDHLLSDVISVIDGAREAAARSVNTAMTTAYWLVGRRIIEEEQQGESRAEYGKQLIARLSDDLSAQLGRGFGARNLRQMRQFFLAWPEGQIWQTASAKSVQTSKTGQLEANNLIWQTPSAKLDPPIFPLPWSSYVLLLAVRNDAARSFYETECLRNGWTVRQLKRQIGSMFYERTALSLDKAKMLTSGELAVLGDNISPQAAIREPYILEFLDLKDEYSESDLEDALITRLADFMLELGDDFAFIGRQRALRIDDEWFKVDLVFYHRVLKALVLIDLKVGKYSYQDAGQMGMYLAYAREHWVKAGENPPVGIILCSEKGADEARYSLDALNSSVLAAEYRTVLPAESVLANELAKARAELEARQ